MRIDADEIDLLRVACAVELKVQHGWDGNDAGHPFQAIAERFANATLIPFDIPDSVGGMALDNEVAEDTVDPLLHLGGEAVHDAVDDNKGGDTKRHRYDRSEGDPTRPKITPTK